MKVLPRLRVDGLHERHPGITQALGESFNEAASVCWVRHHQPPLVIALRHGDSSVKRTIGFAIPDARIRNAHANDIDATEAGSYGVSLAAVEEVVGLVAVSRTQTLTGADWYVAPTGTEIEDLENCIRLEVSGTSAGSSADIERRLRQKISQTLRGQSNLPAIVAVVGFKALEVVISPLRKQGQ